ncbi:MAG: hypothetical protein Rpha_2017 [Candidatus Ruthia sp. Apha_13_S6]|nr:hypothetical protein [Candidatus Ruthia sp. Apha_13_S6]
MLFSSLLSNTKHNQSINQHDDSAAGFCLDESVFYPYFKI